MANKSYAPGGYPVVSDPTAQRRYLQGQLASVGVSIAALNNATNTAGTVFSGLPAPSVSTRGQIRCVTDSTVNTFGATVAGGGANTVLCWCNGTHWTVIGV